GEVQLGHLAALPAQDQERRGVDSLAVPQWGQHGGLQRGTGGAARPASQGPVGGTVTRLKGIWGQEYQDWGKRSLVGKHYVYGWADGVYFNIRLEGGRQCILVLMGATADGKMERIAIQDGQRGSEQSWKELLLDVQARGLTIDPALATGDGGLVFWKAVRQ